MSTHRNIDRICVAVLVFCLLLTCLFVNGKALGLETTQTTLGYETTLFDTATVHTIDIVMDDWDSFLSTAQSEEYSLCSVVIDGESFKNVAIRAKGNTSLSTVASMGSDRYSFKIEFDHYDSGKTYHGLDKLSLNNLIQDTTYMKDYLTYQMMAQFGVASPLCSYAFLRVNGEDWGLYLAVEAVEESFLQRNYATQSGALYKPDSMDMGGGRGNGKDFNPDEFELPSDLEMTFPDTQGSASDRQNAAPGEAMTPGQNPGGNNNFDPSQQSGDASGFSPDVNFQEGGSFDPGLFMGEDSDFDPSQMFGEQGNFDLGQAFGGMDSDDAKLQYIDDDPDSYSTIFDSAKTTVSNADKLRLIESLKALSEGNAQSALDVDAVLRYFVVHNYVVNGDSYTGSMVHNYYLYEQDGLLSMIPWDYNLAFGTFQGGSASSAVNDDIDAPLSVTGSGDRPMMDWILQDDANTQLYHEYFQSFLDTVDIQGIIDQAAALIDPYVQKDPTAFYSYEEFKTGVETLKQFCSLRSQSVQSQLDGSDTPVDTGTLQLSDMGTMNMNNGTTEAFGQMPGGFPEQTTASAQTPELPQDTQSTEQPSTSFDRQNSDRNDGGSHQPGELPTPGTTGTNSSLVLLIASALVLLLGLLIAFFFRRY